MGCQEKPTSHRGATDPPFPALYRAAAACPTLPRLRPMVSREEGVFNISMGGGFLDRPGACRNVGNPGRSVRRFCQIEGFSALSMAGGFLARPAGCWKGGKAAPRVLVFVTPRAFMPPAWRLPKSQRKRAPSRMPRAAAVSILHVINQVFHAINSSGVFQCAHRIIVTVVIGNI